MALIRSYPTWPNLSDFFDDDWFKGRMTNSDWSPAINVVDNEDNYEIEMAVPGLKKEDFRVSVENGVLTITGESKKEEEEKNKNYTRREFSSRSFLKTFTLPENAKDEDISAKYEDGVLHLTVKKSKRALPPKKEVAIG